MSNTPDDEQPCFSVNWVEDGAVFTIERPGKLNSLTKPVLDGLAACLDRLEAGNAKLLVITGQGDRAFCAGTDLGEMRGMTIAARLEKSAMARSLLVRLKRSRIVSVAAINGLALGGGLELAMACTLRSSVRHAAFSLPEIKLGLLPAYAGTQLLPLLVGHGRALELMLTGRTIGPDEALAIGLIHRIAPDGMAVEDAALAFGREIIQYSAAAIAAIRACVDAAGPQITQAGLDVEDAAVRSVFSSPEAEAGIEAFLNKPRTKG